MDELTVTKDYELGNRKRTPYFSSLDVLDSLSRVGLSGLENQTSLWLTVFGLKAFGLRDV